MPEDMPDKMPEDMPDRMPEGMPDRMSDRMPDDMLDKVPECLPDRMPDDLPDRMPEDMPEHMPEDMPGRMAEDMPDRMPDRMPEDMSDRMPEDLPVTKRINVMVGITRSKVIWFLQFLYMYSLIVGLYCWNANQGNPGCKNIRDGGDNVKTGDGGPYMVYFVYRSFQKAPHHCC